MTVNLHQEFAKDNHDASSNADASCYRAVFLLAEAFDDDYFFRPVESPVTLAIGDDSFCNDFADAGQPG